MVLTPEREKRLKELLDKIPEDNWKMIEDTLKRYEEKPKMCNTYKCYICNDTKQIEVRRIGYDSIMENCPYCNINN